MPEYKVRFSGKPHRIDDVGYCVWCYEVSYEGATGEGTPPPSFSGDDKFGIDIPKTLEVLGLDDLTKELRDAIPEAIRGDIGQVHRSSPADRNIIFRKIDPPANSFRICFIAKCGDNDKLVEISLESRDASGWTPLKGRDGKPLKRKLPGPALATARPEPREPVELIAYYEGTKLAHLLSRARFEVPLPQPEPPVPDTGDEPVEPVRPEPPKRGRGSRG